MTRYCPKYCPDCGGKISLIAKSGRMLGETVLLADLQIPTCAKCNEEYWDESLINEADKIWKESYD